MVTIKRPKKTVDQKSVGLPSRLWPGRGKLTP